ncbi:DUF6891 domain-containing protein [Streptomyces purpureus]|uniref:DUF6891 domain-containing protein n=1 Tax=Streptomyces purpureus TaxID=1951 RepID=UPI00037FF2D5|nr:hypothetical protein [Streptomyces purpureus]
MLAITVQTEAGQRHVRPSADDFATLIRRLGGTDDKFLVVERIPELPGVFVQVWHETGGDHTLEHRDGGPDRHFRVTLDGPEPVIAAMTGWARQQDGWDDGLDWERLDFGADAEPAPPLTLDEEDRELLEERIQEVLVGGYTGRAQLAEIAEDYLVSGDHRPVSPAQARELVDRMWLERVAEQAVWEGETDPERLTRAFTALEKAGITARENFTCCRTCGHEEIGAEAAPDARGFVYFHSQCTDGAATGHGLTLLYGGFDGSAGTTTAVGREIVAALEETGLSVDWNGAPEQAITVTPLEWRKRLVG